MEWVWDAAKVGTAIIVPIAGAFMWMYSRVAILEQRMKKSEDALEKLIGLTQRLELGQESMRVNIERVLPLIQKSLDKIEARMDRRDGI